MVIWPAFARCYSSFTSAYSIFNPRPASAQQPLDGPEVVRSSRLPHGGQSGPRCGARAATAETVPTSRRDGLGLTALAKWPQLQPTSAFPTIWVKHSHVIR